MPAEVVGFRNGRALLMPLGDMRGIGPGTVVEPTGGPFRVPVGDALLGRVLDGLGRPIDGGPDIAGGQPRAVAGTPPSPMDRPRISERLELGVRALDALVPCGRGQRLGIFAGSGVGKSTLLGSIARATTASVNVICLVGERGREVLEFIERDLGDALARSVVVVSTSDQPALVRIKAALVATDDRRALPRRGRRRAPDDGLGHPASRWPSARSALRSASRPPPAATRRACSRCCRSCSSAPARRAADRSPASTPSSSRATT